MGNVVTSDHDLASLLGSVEGSTKTAMNQYSCRVDAGMLESAAKQREKRVVELDAEHNDDSMALTLVNPQEVASTITELVPRIEQLNTVYEHNLAIQSV